MLRLISYFTEPVPVILLILCKPPKRIAAAVSVVAVAAAELHPTALGGMKDVTVVCVRLTISAPCNKTTIRQDHQRQASLSEEWSFFDRQINQRLQRPQSVYNSVMAVKWRTHCSDD